jgi:SAM-dependent methyltransferase
MEAVPLSAERLRLSPDALIQRRDGATLLSNPRTRTHVELADADLPRVLALAEGAEEADWSAALAEARGWDRTRFNVAAGLWSDHTGIGPRAGEEPLRGEALLAALRRRMLVHREDGADYDAFLAPLRSVLDRAHLGTFHERVGQFQALELRLRENWRWWHDQKFTADGLAVKPGPYRAVQGAFWDEYYGARDLSGRTVLDFACGNGYYSAKFAALGARVIGIDTNAELIALARANFGDRATFHGPATNAESLAILRSLPDASADLIYMSDVMLILVEEALHGSLREDLRALLAEFRRLLADGGRVEMMEPNAHFWLGGIYGDPARPYTIVPEYRRRVFNVAPTIDQYVGVMAEAGFALVQLLHPGIGDETEADPALRARATAFPLWDFMTFVPVAR